MSSTDLTPGRGPAPAAAAAAASDSAGARLLARHGNAARRYLRVLGCAADRIDDVLQEALLVSIRRGFDYRTDAEAGAYLRHTAKLVFCQQLRSERRRREVALADETWTRWCGEGGDGHAYLDALRACVSRLDERQRRLLDGAYRDGLGRRELGRALGMRPAGVKTALRRLRELLRACVERKQERT